MSILIRVSLELNGRVLDLAVPNGVSLPRLQRVLAGVFAQNDFRMPKSWSLRLKDKPWSVSGFELLEDFPVANGDVFEVVAHDLEHSEVVG